MLINYRGSSI